MNNNQDQQFNDLEEKIKEKQNIEKFEKHKSKTSGKSVFELQKIIKNNNFEDKDQKTKS